MHSDPHYMRHGTKWRSAVEQILVPVLNPPVLRSGRGETGQRERRREDVLAEAGMGVLGIEGIDQKGIVRFDCFAGFGWLKHGRSIHFAWNPALWDRANERIVGFDHEQTL